MLVQSLLNVSFKWKNAGRGTEKRVLKDGWSFIRIVSYEGGQ